MPKSAFPYNYLRDNTENTHLLWKGKYHCLADLLFDRLGFGQTSKSVYSFNSTKQLNPNQSNRRSAVQWYFPLWSECSLDTYLPIENSSSIVSDSCFGEAFWGDVFGLVSGVVTVDVLDALDDLDGVEADDGLRIATVVSSVTDSRGLRNCCLLESWRKD